MRKRKTKKELQKPKLKATYIALGIAAFISFGLIILRAIAFNNAAVADTYSEKVFQPLAKGLSSVINLLPFSLTELLVVGGVLTLTALTVYGIARLIRHPAWRWQIGRAHV